MGLGYYARNGTGLATKGLVGLRSGMRASNSLFSEHLPPLCSNHTTCLLFKWGQWGSMDVHILIDT